jgi:transcriptional regulator with XRE-family HTH domain
MTEHETHPTPGAEFGSLLKAMREKARPFLSQSKLAELACFDHSYVSRLESGARMPTRDAVERLAEALGVSDAERRDLLQHAGFAPVSPQEVAVARSYVTEAKSLMDRAMALLGGA